jgi:hypothetical protein
VVFGLRPALHPRALAPRKAVAADIRTGLVRAHLPLLAWLAAAVAIPEVGVAAVITAEAVVRAAEAVVAVAAAPVALAERMAANL